MCYPYSASKVFTQYAHPTIGAIVRVASRTLYRGDNASSIALSEGAEATRHDRCRVVSMDEAVGACVGN